MVIIHIACIDSSVVGGVQVAVPTMVKAQSQYATVGIYNILNKPIEDVNMLMCEDEFDVTKFDEPFNKPDLVIFHEIYRFKYISIYKQLKKANIPYIIIPHGSLSKTAQQKKALKKKCANLIYFNHFIKSAVAIQYLSNSEKEMSILGKQNSIISGNGINLPHDTKQSFSQNIKFVYIGRLDIHIKGIDILLCATKECEDIIRRQNSIVNIYGPDYNNSYKVINDLIKKLNIEDIVKVNNAIFGTDKENVLLKCDCFVQASRSEGLPLGPIEALSYGLPCIVTEGVGLGDEIEENGAGYKSLTNANSLSEAISKFINNYQDVYKMSKQAIILANNYNCEVIAKKAIEEYLRILKK